jgi:hypothetical protein
METNPAPFLYDAFEDSGKLDRLDTQTGFLTNFTANCGEHMLADFNSASGNGPLAFVRIIFATNEYRGAMVDDNSAYAKHRQVRELTAFIFLRFVNQRIYIGRLSDAPQ